MFTQLFRVIRFVFVMEIILVDVIQLAHEFIAKQLQKIELSIDLEEFNEKTRNILTELVRVPFNSKILKNHSKFFSSLLVDSYSKLREMQSRKGCKDFNFSIRNIQFCPISGSSISDSFLIEGI